MGTREIARIVASNTVRINLPTWLRSELYDQLFSHRVGFSCTLIPIIIILTLIKQVDKTQPYNEDKKEQLINVFEEHSIYVVSAASLNC